MLGCLAILRVEQTGQLLQEGCGSVARGVQMSSCVPVIGCLLLRKGCKFGRHKWVGGNLSAFKGLRELLCFYLHGL